MSIIDHLTDDQMALACQAIDKLLTSLIKSRVRVSEILTPEERRAMRALWRAMEGEHAKDCPQQHAKVWRATET